MKLEGPEEETHTQGCLFKLSFFEQPFTINIQYGLRAVRNGGTEISDQE